MSHAHNTEQKVAILNENPPTVENLVFHYEYAPRLPKIHKTYYKLCEVFENERHSFEIFLHPSTWKRKIVILTDFFNIYYFY